MRRRVRRCSADAGQAVLLLLIVIALATLTVVAAGRLAGQVATRGRAQIAADAAALAAAVHGRQAADRLAAANGGRVLAFDVSGDVVTVTVGVGGEVATARAAAGP
jgi:hypothetical protein